MKKLVWFILLISLAPALKAAELESIQSLEKRVVVHTLKNGLKVILLQRSIAPVVSFQMMFHAGGVDEVSGKTGLAHLFEHMLFKGSEIVGTKNYQKEKGILDQMDQVAHQILEEESKGKAYNPEKIQALNQAMKTLEAQHQEYVIPAEFEEIYQREGGVDLNAFTGQDMTGFVLSLPANKWELWPMMESDRMAHPVLREFYKEREVVMEERRMRYDNATDGKLWENFVAAAFMAHPYGSPTIGWMSDIQKLTVTDAKAFFKNHYAPNNAAVAIVGDIQPQTVIATMEQYFEKVSSQTLPEKTMTQEPPQNGIRKVVVHFDAEPSLMMGFHKPNAPHSDDFAIQVIAELLERGRTSRFNRNIVEKKKAISVWASNGNPGERYPNLIIFGGSPRKPFDNADLEKAIWQELERLKKEKVSQKELQKVRNQIEADFIRQLGSNSTMAGELVYAQTVLGDWKYVFQYLEGIGQVTPEQVQKAAQNYFKKSNATVAFLERATD